jgi:DNA-binding response OmpR family regulator
MTLVEPARRILIADDDEDVRETITFNLQMLGYQVTGVGNGEDALRVARQMVPELIILDLMMPELNGFEVLASLRGHPATREVPVVVLSARAADADVWEGWKAGADYYITKPFVLDELIHFIDLLG